MASRLVTLNISEASLRKDMADVAEFELNGALAATSQRLHLSVVGNLRVG
jgi:hypothetical protein